MLNSSVAFRTHCEEDFFSNENVIRADATVIEIFNVMFGFDINAVDVVNSDRPLSQLNERTAIVGFSGCMRGWCEIRTSSVAARSIASAMLGGAPIDEDDESINDALGELCNMLAGGWKNSVPALSSECALSPPTVISGQNYKVHMSKPSVQMSRTYEFDSNALYLTLYREVMEQPQD